MTTPTPDQAPGRPRLSRERALQTALRRADQGGIAALSMRRLGQELGVEAMALYYHFRNKGEVLDGMIDLVFGEIDMPPGDVDWKTAMRRRAISAREVLSRHRWAIGLMESRTNPGPANLRHHDAVLGSLRAAGFTIEMAAHAYSLLDSYVYGFVLQEQTLPFDPAVEVADVARHLLKPLPADEFPNLAAMIEHVLRPGYSYGHEFEFGIDLILDGLERNLSTA